MTETNLKKAKDVPRELSTHTSHHLIEIAVEMLQRYGEQGQEMTPDEILFRAENAQLIDYKRISMQQVHRVLEECWKKQHCIFYVVNERCFGLQAWREREEKSQLWEIIHKWGKSQFGLVEFIAYFRNQLTTIDNLHVFDMLREFVEDGLLGRDDNGEYVKLSI
ncbi:MAG: hypothetical protein RTU30_01810 [Candidatus Thorarchaeota archaeon]